MSARTFVDRGGTFTDVIVWPRQGMPVITKVPSDTAVVGSLARGPLTFGTTVATNALLERRGVRTALIVTEGFADLIRIRHMARPGLFDPDQQEAPPLCHRVVEVQGRRGSDGQLVTPLDLSSLPDLSDVEAVAICLLHGPMAPQDERAVAAEIGRRHPTSRIVCGHEVDPEPGYLGRIETTLVDASITPVLHAAMRRDRIPEGARAMRSDGGLSPASSLRAPDAVLSGPAGGVLAVAEIARQAGLPGAIGLDMGGTSTDVCLVMGSALPRRRGDVAVADTFLRRPMLEVETIAAGGGSVLGDDGVQLTVGPRSAGADPGPACYGKGGPPTLTDAALVAGLVDSQAFNPPLDPSAVDLPGPAEGFLAVAREAMASAVRRLAASRGVDLRPLALVAYGGAAGAHAAEVAARLGIRKVLVHPLAAVLSAFGQGLAGDTRVASRPLWQPLAGAGSALRQARAKITEQLGGDLEPIVTVAIRLEGTDHALEVPWSDDPDRLAASWHAEHERVWGFRRGAGALEIEGVRGRVTRPPPPLPDLSSLDPWELGDGEVHGPHRLDTPTTSIQVPEGWRAARQGGLLVLEHIGAPAEQPSTQRTETGVAIWTHRFGAVAEQAGEQLVRLARSVNIRERRDFSIGLFRHDGQMVAHAPHIPVHLGAMGETVRDLLKHDPDPPVGQAWLTNAPDAGGSHLPDLTVITRCDLDDHRFFVASRAHHADVGGLTPGSMPPHSTTIDEEGLVFRRLPLLLNGGLRPDLRVHLTGARRPDVLQADLEAQLAAHRHAHTALADLGRGDVLAAWCDHLLDAARDAVLHHLPLLPDGQAKDDLDGLRLSVQTYREAGGLCVSWEGTDGPHAGNLNAPGAVVRAAVLYALRVAIGRPLPMNEGLLAPVRVYTPPSSVVSPPPGAAVVGGNVETSQRLVDLLMQAWQVRAQGCGTMSNLSVGGEGWSHYETLGGGQGASARGPGMSGRQVHMTNTRATDPEVLERRLPLRLWRFALRGGSGGSGRHHGGQGLVREIEVLAPATVALLSADRPDGAAGLGGGGNGAPGRAWIDRGDGTTAPWDGCATTLSSGGRVRVETPGGGGFGATDPRDAAPETARAAASDTVR